MKRHLFCVRKNVPVKIAAEQGVRRYDNNTKKLNNQRMSEIKHLYPTGRGFSQVVIAKGDQHIVISGQCSFDAVGKIVGVNEIAIQTDRILKNIKQGLSKAGASFDELVKMTNFVVDYDREKREQIQLVRDRYISVDAGSASTLIGVTKLVHDDLLLEIEAHAIR